MLFSLALGSFLGFSLLRCVDLKGAYIPTPTRLVMKALLSYFNSRHGDEGMAILDNCFCDGGQTTLSIVKLSEHTTAWMQSDLGDKAESDYV